MTDELSVNLLLVEDDHLLRLDAEDMLTESGFTVTSVSTAEEAFSALDKPAARFDGVVTDIRLGKGANGWRVGQYARERLPAVPVVYVTADSAAEWTSHGVPNSMLIQKPFVPAQLIAAITGLLNQASMTSAC